MLTRDLLRFRAVDGRVQPTFARATPATVALCEELARIWSASVGLRRRELEEHLLLAVNRARSALLGKGLARVLEGLARFTEPASREELRARACVASARLLAAPAADMDAHRAAVAAELAMEPQALKDELYADLPDAEVLAEAPAIAPAELIARYNLALCQGLLLGAESVRVRLAAPAAGVERRLFAALRFRRLVAAARSAPDGALELEVTGPAAMLDSAQRYGLQLALFLPAVAAERGWSLSAMIGARARAGGGGALALTQEDGLWAPAPGGGFVPEELRRIAELLGEKLAPWRVAEAAPLVLQDGEIIAPDLALARDGRVHPLELFHRWHASALARRLDQLARGLLPGLVIGVDRALLRSREGIALAAHPQLAARGFQFSEMPSARALLDALARQDAPAAR